MKQDKKEERPVKSDNLAKEFTKWMEQIIDNEQDPNGDKAQLKKIEQLRKKQLDEAKKEIYEYN